MSAPAFAGRPALTIRGTRYPVLLPTVRDPRLHLAAVIVTLQVLGQTAFGFQLSIAQILVALGTCAVLEVGIAFVRHKILLWPASALLTGNGVAFVLRVPGTPHGDWWSLHGAWIFAGTAAIALLSKHLIRYGGRHLFNPSNFGLVVCFLALGKGRADPLDFWWGPISVWLALAVCLIVVGGLTILSRLRLLFIAVTFWLTFAAGIAVLAASGHSMTARWHLGPISGWDFWWLLVSSPEILVFLFFMITDPQTIPRGRVARLVYAMSVGLLATLLIAPTTTEFATKVAVLAALALVCLGRPLLERLLPAAASPEDQARMWASRTVLRPRRLAATFGLVAALAVALVALDGIPTRPVEATAASLPATQPMPAVTVEAVAGVSSKVDRKTARAIARDVVLDLRAESDALRLRDPQRAAVAAAGPWLENLQRRIGAAAGDTIAASSYAVEDARISLAPGEGQGPPRILVELNGTQQAAVYRGRPPVLVERRPPSPFTRSLEVALSGGHYVIVGSDDVTTSAEATAAPAVAGKLVRATGALAGVHLQDVARQVGLDFRQGAFRYGVSPDTSAMMGGGLCWLDYDGDGWLDLFVVNSYASSDRARYESDGGLPRSALFHNVDGAFVNVSRSAHADLAVQGDGCVAADFDGDGRTDLLVTTTSYDKLLWNDGDGTFSEGAEAAGIHVFGWHTGAAVADVNGDGRPDLFVAGYTDLSQPVTSSIAGFPSNFQGVRDLLYLNEGPGPHGHATFREVGVPAGLESARFSHGLGAVFTDYDGDGRPDLYVANDEDLNQLYENVGWPGGARADPAGLGFRFEERGAAEGVADPYAGMGIASDDYDGDGRPDLVVTNSRREPHAAFARSVGPGPAFRDARSEFRPALAASSTGWGATWADLALDGRPELAIANGAIPVTNLAQDAGRLQIVANVARPGALPRFANVGLVAGSAGGPRVNGRGLAAADYDNDGTVDLAVGSIGGRLVLLRNAGERGHWLEVSFPTFAAGAVVTAELPDGRSLVQELHVGSSYLSSEDPRVHLGLGKATSVRRLTVRFPNGTTTRLSNVAADRVVVAKEPAAPATRDDGAPSSYLAAGCRSTLAPNRSVARLWDETAARVLGSSPPPEQARDLFHLSAAMWDAWAAYDPKAEGYFSTEKLDATDIAGARSAAISFAAYRLLLWRASYGRDVRASFARLTATLRSLCYRPGFTDTRGDSPAALGNRIAAAAIAYGRTDGSLEGQHYVDPSFTAANEPLVVGQPGATMHDRTFWQPLALDQVVVQGGLPVPAKVQTFVGSQWERVRPFALAKDASSLDPGPPPTGDPSSAAYKRAAVEAIRARAARSESAALTSPAGWNEAATADAASRSGSTAGTRLARDVRLYFALNGALHDAAIAAWHTKREYQAVRPISMVRSLAFAGQSSDPHAASYSPDGLPLVPGLVELVTRASSGRHAALAGHVGEVAVRTDRGWVLGTRWTPRGVDGSVTPPYPGWPSDESAFASAAAVILRETTGKSHRAAAEAAASVPRRAGTETAADVTAGRRIGSAVGRNAWARAQRYFSGAAG
jgi:Na+-translocating ferredoxin:NAD+ oxidoreductase RnfD subunit